MIARFVIRLSNLNNIEKINNYRSKMLKHIKRKTYKNIKYQEFYNQ